MRKNMRAFRAPLIAAVALVCVSSQVYAQAAPTVVYEEDFEGAATPSQIDSIGFTSDPNWNNSRRCNGILLDTTSTSQYNGPNGSCRASSMTQLSNIAGVLGGPGNTVASSYTDRGSVAPDTLQLQTPSFSITPNRFYAASIDVGAVNCFGDISNTNVQNPVIGFELVDSVSGTTLSLGPSIDACQEDTDGTTNGVRNATIVSPEPLRWIMGSSAAINVINSTTTGTGNDGAVDNLLLNDVTPQLEKTFDSPVAAGAPTTMTFSITNTTDYLPKLDMDFTDVLPAGLSVHPSFTPVTTGCGDGTVDVSNPAEIFVSGIDIAGGAANAVCTISVEVVAPLPGPYTNDASNITGFAFVIPPTAPAVLEVTAPVAEDEAETVSSGDTLTFDVSANDDDFADVPSDNLSFSILSNTLPAGTAAPTIGTDGTVEWDSTGAPAGVYEIEYEICNDLVDPTVCATATLTITVPPEPELTLSKTATPNSGYEFGETITYTYEVENTGNVTINNVTVTDQHTSAAGTAALAVGGDTAGTDIAPLGDSSDDGDADNGIWGTLAPGDTVTFTSEYTVTFADALSGNDLENTATVTGTPISGTLSPVSVDEQVSLVAPTARPALLPASCGSYVAEGFLGDALVTEPAISFGAGDLNDPYAILPITRNATTGEILFYGPTADATLTGSDLTSDMTSELTTQGATTFPRNSEYWRVTMRLDGQPGTSETIQFDTEGVHEFTAYWITNASGTSLSNGDWVYTVGAAAVINIPVSYPAEGYVYLNIAMIDPVNRHGEYTVPASGYTCPPAIIAEDDDFTSTPVDPDAGGAAGNIFTNDGFDNGDPIVPAETTITVVDNDGLTGVSIATDGTLTVPPNTPPGLYEVEYQICETGVIPENCDTAIAEVLVLSIDAVDDPTASITGGGTLPSVLGNDSFNGSTPADLADVALTPGTAPTLAAGSIIMNADGTITVSPDATPGTYTYEYEICSIDYPAICDTATATILVEVLQIDAIDDTFPIANGADGGTTPSVLDNDSYAGIIPAMLTDVTLTPGAAPTPPAGAITMNPDGTITVDPGTTAGTYTYPYEICETGAVPDNCDTAIATVIVEPPEITADNDDFSSTPIDGADGGTAGDAYDGDTLNGAPVDPADITPTVLTPAAPINGGPVPELVLSGPNEGEVTVPAGTPAGTYTIEYQICEDFNPTNCANAEITVVVDPTSISADDDDFSSAPINGADGGTVGSAYDGDTLNGDPVDAAEITPTVLTPAVSIDGGPVPELIVSGANEGDVTVPAGTPAGTYTIAYQICEDLNPTNCDQALITVEVAPSLIEAINDDFSTTPTDGLAGGTTPSVLDNDELNDVVLDPADIVLTPGTAPTPTAGSITMNPDGTITVAPGTTAGSYTYPYTICEDLNPTNCSDAVATVVVDPPEGTELIDDISAGNIPGTAVTVQVLNNDPDGSDIIDPTTLTIVGTSGPGQPLVVPGEGTWTVDLATGSITFTPEPGFTGNPTPIEYQVADIFGNTLAPAIVTVLYEADAAFVCSDVIGKVFDDKNHDGRQDPGERGIASARLATVNGFIITTDEHGRFSIPCAAIPSDIGSTFLLKLDPRSLPTGYRLTTENPKTVRLTQGTMRRMNFGATISNLVRVDLTRDAFVVKSKGGRQVLELSKELDEGLKALVRSIAKEPSTIRLSYYPNGEDSKIAKRRLNLVEDRLKELWRGRGRYQLSLEKTIVVRK